MKIDHNIAPLFNLETACVGISFICNRPLAKTEILKRLRSHWGKWAHRQTCKMEQRRSCLKDQNERVSCPYSLECRYVSLFAPGKQLRPWCLPYAESSDSEGRCWKLQLTLFGPALAEYQFVIDCIRRAINEFPGRMVDVAWLHPAGADVSEASGDYSGYSLSIWLQGLNSRDLQWKKAQVVLKTPVFNKVLRRQKGVMPFGLLFRMLLRRMKDLKRMYGADNNMGEAASLYDLADTISLEQAKLVWSSDKHFSKRQKNNVNLSGFSGSLIFAGDLQPFLPFLFAGEMIQIGKKTTYGNGQLAISHLT